MKRRRPRTMLVCRLVGHCFERQHGFTYVPTTYCTRCGVAHD